MAGRALVLRADARSLPLPDESVDLIVTSPPYWALRSYTDGGEHYEGQIGSEPTPREYVEALLMCTREWMRVLKPSGSMWIDLGDVYYSGKGAPGRMTADAKTAARTFRRAGGNPLDGPSFGVARKSLVLLPERYRIACVDELGLLARAVVVWSKPNGLPESVTDRVRRSHEDWVHLTKGPRYFAAVDEIREPHSENTHARRKDGGLPPKNATGLEAGVRNGYFGDTTFNSLGRLPGSVWQIPTQPLTVPDALEVEHFAAFPMEWPRRLILGWSPSGICAECGEGRRVGVCACTPFREHPERRVASVTPGRQLGRGHQDNAARAAHAGTRHHGNDWPKRQPVRDYDLDGWTPPPTTPAVVLDPFGGTGTTALVAAALGRIGISVDLSMDYCRLAMWRTNDPGERARALRVPKPEPVAETQLSLFDGALT